MKALVKKTGKIVNVSRTGSTYCYSGMSGSYYEHELCFDDFEIQEAEKWEQRRYEIAKDILLRTVNSSLDDTDTDVNFAVEYADAIIEKLKKK